MPPGQCNACGKAFTGRRKDASYCSAACRQRAHRNRLAVTRPAQIYPVSLSAAARLMNVSRRSCQYARKVGALGIPELLAAVEQGDVKVSAAAEISELPAASQLRVLGKIRQGARAAAAYGSEILALARLYGGSG
jgi:hypothetical protein